MQILQIKGTLKTDHAQQKRQNRHSFAFFIIQILEPAPEKYIPFLLMPQCIDRI